MPTLTASSGAPPQAPSASEQTAGEAVSHIDDSENVHMGDAAPAGTHPVDQLSAAPISEGEDADISDIPQSFETSAACDEFEYSEQCLDELQQRLPILRRYLLATVREVDACNNLIIHYKASKETQNNRK